MNEASPDYSDGCMIALHPPAQLAQTLTVPGGLPAAEMHVTVAYCGKAADIDVQALIAAVKAVTARPPIDAQISGHARFTGGDSDVIVALVDSADLEDLRRDLVDVLTAQGIQVPREHGFCPHATISYIDRDADSPVDRLTAIPVTFGALSVVHGRDRTDLPFTGNQPHPIADVAKEAYAAGWALSGGPMTDRVRAGASAAVQLAVEHADDPGILEVTLHLGHLEGVWATVYDRREKLIADHTAAVTKAWKAAFRELDVGKAITRYRATSFPAEAVDLMLTMRRAEAKSAALGLLSGIHYADAYPKLQARVADALRAARAEGHISAQRIHAEHKPRESATVDDAWAIDFDRYYEQLGLLDDWPALADGWVQNLVDGASTDLGNTLAAMTRDGASYEDMLSAADDLLGSGDIRAVSTLLDYAMSDAITQASVDLYASEGVASYDILTASDTRVCKRCMDAEADNPYPVTQSPPTPLHPACVIGSTRVSAPTLVVAGDEPDRLTLDPAHATTRRGGEIGPSPASAVTEAGLDFGRGDIRAVTVREYVGDVITIRVASGQELTATPNHPVATPGGWVPVAELAVGDYVLCSTSPEWGASSVDPDVDNVPPCIEDVAETFPGSSVTVDLSAEDFHGDGAGSRSATITTSDSLCDDCRDDELSGSYPAHGYRTERTVPGDRGTSQRREPAGRTVDRSLDHVRRSDPTRPAARTSREPSPSSDASSQGACGDSGDRTLAPTSADVLSPRENSTGHPTPAVESSPDSRPCIACSRPFVPPSPARPWDVGAHSMHRTGQDFRTSLSENDSSGRYPWKDDTTAVGTIPANAEGFCERLLALSREIAASEVVDIQRDVVATHVYNLETAGGWYVSNSIVTHNCRCAIAPSISAIKALQP